MSLLAIESDALDLDSISNKNNDVTVFIILHH